MSNAASSDHFDKLIAGALAGLLESLTTYPTEYSVAAILSQTYRHGKVMQTLYCGASSFCISNAAKSGVRFVVFDKARSYVSRDQETGNWSTSSNLAAGLVAGAEESVLVVTPGETLKTRIIENRQMPRCQRFNGVFDAIRSIIRTDGPSGIYKGVIPVTLKQSSNAMVRFTSYNAFLSLLDNTFRGRLDSGKPAVAGASAGVVTVYATMPFDSVKTCLQAASATTLGTYECITSMIRGDGITSLWRGTTPRLMRLTVFGAISFTIYDHTYRILEMTRSSQRVTVHVNDIMT